MANLQILLFLLGLVSSSFLVPLEKTPKADDVDYRLPDLVIPSHYSIDLTLQKDAFEKNAFSGVVAITLEIKEGSTTKDIVLHTKNLVIPSDGVSLVKKVEVGDDVSIPILPPADTAKGYVSDPVTDKLTLSTQDVDLVEGDDYLLTIQYTGAIDDTSLYGFYKNSYMEGEIQKFLAVTQFAEGYARRAFPCFDEPSIKAIFEVSITKPKTFNIVFSNTLAVGDPVSVNDDLDKVQFEATPKMSTYLVAFLVSEFDCTAGNTTDEQVPTEVCSRPLSATNDQRHEANLVGPLALNVLKTYTGVGYKASGIGKMYMLALPDFALGAMENWGLVTFRERDLLWDPDQSSNRYRQSIVSVITHEFSHQWFGDLVTFDWWSDVFINEGFASYFEYYATDKIEGFKSWEMPQQFAIEELQTAFLSDSSLDSKPLSSPVGSLEEAASKFDDIAYNKGGSIFRMVHHFLTEDKFIEGLKQYIADNPYENTVAEDVWDAMSVFADELPEDLNLPDVMKNWIHEAGYPLLTVTKEGNDLKISQARFLDSGESPTKWYVPISYVLSTDEAAQATVTTARTWLTPTADLSIVGELEGVDWVVLNNMQTGYYRVDYGNDLWTSITAALKAEAFSGIHVSQRAQIVDDLFALAKANKRSYEEVLDLLSFLENEVAYYPWYSAFRGIDLLLQRVANSKLRSSLNKHFTQLSSKLYKSMPIGTEKPDDQIFTLNQVQSMMWACKFGVKDCIQFAKESFAGFRDTTSPVSPTANSRTVVYCHALFNSDDIAGDWDFLYNKLLVEDLSTEQVTIINALGCTTDVDTLNGTLTDGTKRNCPDVVCQILCREIRLNEAIFTYNHQLAQSHQCFSDGGSNSPQQRSPASALGNVRGYLTKIISADGGIRKQDASTAFASVYSNSQEGVDASLEFITTQHQAIVDYFHTTSNLISLISNVANRFTVQAQIDKLNEFITNTEGLDEKVKAAGQTAAKVASDNLAWIKRFEGQISAYFGAGSTVRASIGVLCATLALVLARFV